MAYPLTIKTTMLQTRQDAVVGVGIGWFVTERIQFTVLRIAGPGRMWKSTDLLQALSGAIVRKVRML